MISASKKNPPRLPVSLLVAAGGALGTLARHAIDTAFPPAPGTFPWTTLAINTAGSLLLGLILATSETHPRAPRWLHPLAGIGFCGAFTTFSTVSLEFIQLTAAHPGTAAPYILASIAAGVAAAALGTRLGTK